MIKRVREFVSRYKGWIAAGVVVLALGWMGYLRFVRGIGWAAWTGFGGETLLDWLELLIIPIIIAAGAWWLDRRQKKAEREFEQARLEKDREIAREKRQDATLEAYFDRMTALLLEEGLRDPDASEKVKKIARMRTRVVLRRLDGKRNGHVIRFLEEAGLLSADDPLVSITEINLRGADLDSIDLAGSDLSSADLQEARLGSANLRGANLNASDLRRSKLSGSNLSKAALLGTKLGKVWLVHARLRGADLRWADLQETKLVVADLRGADLRGAENLDGADFKGAKLDGAKVWARDVEALKSGGADVDGVKIMEAPDQD
jgi:uncharacterized protein YjbI with pentapeptide repeats